MPARASSSLATTRIDFHRQSAPAKAIAIEIRIVAIQGMKLAAVVDPFG